MLRPCLSFSAILIASVVAYGQATFTGSVIEVIDGRTLVIETSRSKVKTQLQFIETPEPDQPLHAAVREHLTKLALNQAVEFRPLRINDVLTVGRVSVAGADLSLQLLRDGAAWHEPQTTSGQSAEEALNYAEQQELAKSEKRGVWSIPDLKTPWQIRAERQAATELVEAARRSSKPVLVGVNQFQTPNRSSADLGSRSGWTGGRNGYDLWGDVFARAGKETVGLQIYSDPQGRYSGIYTPAAFVKMGGGKVDRRLECRLISFQFNLPNGRREEVYLLGFQTVAADYHFSKGKSRLSVVAGRRSIAIGPPLHGFRGDTTVGSIEMFFYRITKAQIKSFGRAKSLDIRIDGMLGSVPADAVEMFRELAATID